MNDHPITSAAAVLTLAATRAARADTLVVPDDYATIQLAVDAAREFDTVKIKAGDYRVGGEGIVVHDWDHVTIKAADDANVVIHAPEAKGLC